MLRAHTAHLFEVTGTNVMDDSAAKNEPKNEPMNEPRINVVEMTVSELSMALKRAIEDGFGHVRVRGELGNVKYHSSGHIYLDLKDERACLAGVIWRNVAPRIKLK